MEHEDPTPEQIQKAREIHFTNLVVLEIIFFYSMDNRFTDQVGINRK